MNQKGESSKRVGLNHHLSQEADTFMNPQKGEIPKLRQISDLLTKLKEERNKIIKKIDELLEKDDESRSLLKQEIIKINNYGRNLLKEYGIGINGEEVFWRHSVARDFTDEESIL